MTLTLMIYALNFDKICCSVSGIIHHEKNKIHYMYILFSRTNSERKKSKEKRYLRESVG